MKKIHTRIMYAFMSLILFFSMMGGCNSCANSKRIDESEARVKSFLLGNCVTKQELEIIMKIENLKAERRSVLNINQIFLTNKRPDERVIEIDEKLESLNVKKDSLVKKIKKDVENIETVEE